MITGHTLQIVEGFNYEDIKNFTVFFTAGGTNNAKVNARIYIAKSCDSGSNYMLTCRMKNFRYEIHAGPVYWTTEQWVDNKVYSTPNLAEILKPFLDRSLIGWKRYVFVIIEWLAPPNFLLNWEITEKPYYLIHYQDNRPGMIWFSLYSERCTN